MGATRVTPPWRLSVKRARIEAGIAVCCGADSATARVASSLCSTGGISPMTAWARRIRKDIGPLSYRHISARARGDVPARRHVQGYAAIPPVPCFSLPTGARRFRLSSARGDLGVNAFGSGFPDGCDRRAGAASGGIRPDR